MSYSSRRQITIERHSVTKIRISGKSRYVFCEVCKSETLAFSSEQMAKFLQIIEDEILRRIELGDFHLIGGKETRFVCGNSTNI